MNPQLKFMNTHNLRDGNLRELVTKKLWAAAAISCWEALGRREKEKQALSELLESIKEEEEEEEKGR